MNVRRIHLSDNFSEAEYEYLDACARIRDVSVPGLIKMLIRVIAEDQMVRSIMDDDSQPVDRRVTGKGLWRNRSGR